MIAVVSVAHVRFALNAILTFWIAYILTRPLGASIGDYLSQPKADGGLGLGTTVTSVLFLTAILAVVIFLSITRRDETPGPGRLLPRSFSRISTSPPCPTRTCTFPTFTSRTSCRRAPRATRASRRSCSMRKAPSPGPFASSRVGFALRQAEPVRAAAVRRRVEQAIAVLRRPRASARRR